MLPLRHACEMVFIGRLREESGEPIEIDLLGGISESGLARRLIAENKVEEFTPFIKQFLTSKDIEFEEDSAAFRILSREFLKTFAEMADVEAERCKGNYDNPYDKSASYVEIAAASTASDVAPVAEAQQRHIHTEQLKMSQLIEKYCADQQGSSKWSDKSALSARARLDAFIYVMGDMAISGITFETIGHYREALRQLPLNRNKSPQYLGKTATELLAMSHSKTLSTTTINTHIGALNSLFEWAFRRDLMPKNCAR